MKYFKTKPVHNAKRHEITYDEFLKATGRKYPFEQNNIQGKIAQYGICPSCLNSIQLIGLLKQTEKAPYGKHTGRDIKDLPYWNQRKYEYCPFAAKNKHRKPNDEVRLTEIDDGTIELYDLLKAQFDRVVFILENELNIHFSSVFLKKALNQYLVNKAYSYPWLTEANLPYVFAYFGIHCQKVYKQRFLVDSEVYNALLKHPDVDFIKSDDKYQLITNKDNSFLNLFFRFTDHIHNVSNGETLKESMLFCIDDRSSGKTVYEKKITFDETYFINFVYNRNESERRQWLLNIADELMPPLELT